MTDAPVSGAGAKVPAPRSRRTGELVFVGVIIAFAIFALILTGGIREPVGSSNVLGARVLPYAVNGLMLLAGIGALVAVLRGDVGAPDEGEDIDLEAKTSWKTVILVALSFLSLIAFIPLAGWPIAVTVLFTGAALALGARSWWRATLIGLALGIVTQLVFGVLLGLSLPPFGTILTGVL